MVIGTELTNPETFDWFDVIGKAVLVAGAASLMSSAQRMESQAQAKRITAPGAVSIGNFVFLLIMVFVSVVGWIMACVDGDVSRLFESTQSRVDMLWALGATCLAIARVPWYLSLFYTLRSRLVPNFLFLRLLL